MNKWKDDEREGEGDKKENKRMKGTKREKGRERKIERRKEEK